MPNQFSAWQNDRVSFPSLQGTETHLQITLHLARMTEDMHVPPWKLACPACCGGAGNCLRDVLIAATALFGGVPLEGLFMSERFLTSESQQQSGNPKHPGLHERI